MPTGLTSKIYEGKDIAFKEFAILCARSFGALIHQRDEPLDAPIRKREPDTYYLEELEKAKKDLDDFLANPPTEEFLAKEWEEKVEKMKKDDAETNKKHQELKARYEAMLKQVQAWNPPTIEHKNLKNFMIKQLNESILFDCYVSNQVEHFVTKEQYIKDSLSSMHLEKQVEYYQKQWDKQIESCNNANKWIEELVNSLEEQL